MLFLMTLSKNLPSWKREDCEVVPTRGFNDDVYRGKITEKLADTDLNMTEQTLKTTAVGIQLTREHHSKATCMVFATAGVKCKAVKVTGVRDRRHPGLHT